MAVSKGKSHGEELIDAAEEALRFARGEKTGAQVAVVDVPDVPALRKKLGFTQEEFARRFGVSLGTLRNWEQGQRVPEGPARVLLKVIDRNPQAVKRALEDIEPVQAKMRTRVVRSKTKVRKPARRLGRKRA